MSSFPIGGCWVTPEATPLRGDGRGGAFLKPGLAPTLLPPNDGRLPPPAVDGACAISGPRPTVLLLFLVPELLVDPLLDNGVLYGSACART